MAITLDAFLGSGNANGASVSFTTTSAVASGGFVVVYASWWDNINGTITVSVGGQTPTNDAQLNQASSDRAAVLSKSFPSGLASGSTISLSSGAGAGKLIAAVSYLGVTGVDKTGNTTGTTAAAWAGSSLSPAIADSVFCCVAGTDGTQASQSNTAVVGNERADQFNAASSQGAVAQDLIVSSTASNAVSGTWGTTTGLTTQTIVTVIYSGSSAAAGPLKQAFIPIMAPQGGLM